MNNFRVLTEESLNRKIKNNILSFLLLIIIIYPYGRGVMLV